ncbi:MAG TPA: adenylate/guanylate cyclase domain-containing protein [Syntrophales bacterium]|mgnify:CR=1 FL=1|nr:adenylate/guanylate cyclase domain-containing protein [Syntrophales bacterium]HPQ44793.1 adenylate/guanylate cyclase domain-containing protein [Syntrophales bacterium]
MTGLLVVDDEEGVRRSLKKVLERDGYSVLLAEDGDQAIRIVRENPYRIETVISDYKMPGIDGLETLIEIGKINPEVTRIMLTGYATMESAIESVNAGIDGFITKPFSNIELKAKVREYNLRKRLKQFVSEQVFSEMSKGEEHIRSEKRKVTVLFSDIRSFTELSESLNIEEMCELLNICYFSPLDAVICRHNGTLDKHVGDSIMGIFGAPLTFEDDAVRAVTCAIEMMEEIERINSGRSATDRKISIGIGISTGEVMAGIFGSSRKKEYTVMGSTVNVASRLEKLARARQILMCGNTYDEVKDHIRSEDMGPVMLKGMDRKVNIYNVLGPQEKTP